MKTKIVPMIGDPLENFYQLGQVEKKSFLALEKRVHRLLSTLDLLSQGQQLLSSTRLLFQTKKESFFFHCLRAYADGMSIKVERYLSFIQAIEMAAHYGQIYPQLKSILPGCTSVIQKKSEEITHTRILDFPLLQLFDEHQKLYFFQFHQKPSFLSYSSEGLAPLIFQGLHEKGLSLALHSKPNHEVFQHGENIFSIVFESIFNISSIDQLKDELKKHQSISKWAIVGVDQQGAILHADLEGAAQHFESFHLENSPQFIFTNLPIKKNNTDNLHHQHFSHSREKWILQKLKKNLTQHPLDVFTDIEDQKIKHWEHPAATLSSIAGYHINLTKGFLDLKNNQGVTVKSEAIWRFDLAKQSLPTLIKSASPLTSLEEAWKRAAKAQSFFDEGELDLCYHELQMAMTLMPLAVWKNIFSFYLCLLDFKFISNKTELALVYKKVLKLSLPELLKDQWHLLKMRFEKQLGLTITVETSELSLHMKPLFEMELDASPSVFTAWMKLLYPRLEILDVLTPYFKS